VIRLWRTMLIHRGQKDHLTWARMRKLADRWIPRPRVLHPYPRVRFDATHPREEPHAVVPPVGICAGGAGRPASLPRPWPN
jgi:hypothetical protein